VEHNIQRFPQHDAEKFNAPALTLVAKFLRSESDHKTQLFADELRFKSYFAARQVSLQTVNIIR
tara:strand:- start:2491 stop:2682 length:192 start_codon:yes stop_codon:yes gene_type:complete